MIDISNWRKRHVTGSGRYSHHLPGGLLFSFFFFVFFFFAFNNAENKEKHNCGSFGIKIRREPDKYVFALVRATFAAR